MEIDPRYTQYPESLRDVYVATSAATPAGTAISNAPAGTVTSAAAGANSAIPATSTAPSGSATNRMAMNAQTSASDCRQQ